MFVQILEATLLIPELTFSLIKGEGWLKLLSDSKRHD